MTCDPAFEQILAMLMVLGWVLVLGAALTLRDKNRAIAQDKEHIRRLQQRIEVLTGVSPN